MATALSIPDRLASTSDDEIMRMHAAVKAVRDTRRWEEIAATFPPVPKTIEEWRAVWTTFDYRPFIEWREKTVALVAKEGLDHRAIREWYRHRRHEFIEHWGTTYDPRNAGVPGRSVKMPMLLFPRQRDFITFLTTCLEQEAHGQGEKVRDFGATWLCAFFSINLWCCEPGSASGWGSRKEELVDRIGDPDSIFEKIRIGIRALPPFLKPDGLIEQDHLVFMKCINPETGATITGECGDNIGRGGRSLIYFKDESAHYARPDLIEASLGDNTNVQIDISTPNGLGNVFHRRRNSGVVWTGGEMVKGRANVFIMDWRDHPAKTEQWYKERREKAVREGLLHKFKQEVDRDYAASVEGIIIKPEWVMAARDAHLKLGLDIQTATWSVALDVADGMAGDGNALAAFEGIVLRHADAWGEVDAGAATRRTLQFVEDAGIPDADLQYDSVGIGGAVKAEVNRLAEDGLDNPAVRWIPWNAGARVLNPDAPINPDDMDSPTNGAMFANFRAQAWWMVARRFENTYRAVEEGVIFEPHELISIDSRIPLLLQLESELSQPTIKKRPSDMKLIVDKQPEGTTSPNLGDATIMAAFPAEALAPVYPTAIPQFSVAPFQIPAFWPKVFTMKVEPELTTALWGALDREQGILYVTTEHSLARADATANAAAIRSRGDWISGWLESDETNLEARRELALGYVALGLKHLNLADRAEEAGIADMLQRVTTGRLKVFSTCQGFFRAYRSHRRDADGKIIGAGLMDCARVLCRPATLLSARVKPKTQWGIVDQAPGTRAPVGHVGDRKFGY